MQLYGRSAEVSPPLSGAFGGLEFLGMWGSEGSGEGQFSRPWWVAVGRSGEIYASDTVSDRVQKFSTEGRYLGRLGSRGTGDGQFTMAGAIAVDGDSKVQARYIFQISNV